MKRATQFDVAKLAGVSQATVSHVLNGASSPRKRVSDGARRRVLDAMESVGYVANPMAQGLAGGRSRILGVFTYESVFPRDRSNFYHPFLVGMEAQAETTGVDLLLFTSAPHDGGRRRLADDGWNRIAVADGCILIGRLTDRNEVAWLLERRYPFVFIGRRDHIADQEVPFVGADYVTATAELTRRMLELGHRRIAFVGDLSGAVSALDRVNGYRQAMQDADLRPLMFDAGAFSPDETVQILVDHKATGALFGAQTDTDAIMAAAERAGVSGYPIVAAGLTAEQSLDLVRERWAERLEIIWPDQPDLVVLPEHGDRPIIAMDPYENISIEAAAELTAAKGDAMVEFYGDLARQHNTHIAYSGYRVDEAGQLRNATQIIGPEGTVLGVYDKMHLTIPEHRDRDIIPGDGMKVIETAIGRIAPVICFDLNFVESVPELAALKPEIIVFGSAYHGGFMQQYWAYQTQSWFVGAVHPPNTSQILTPMGDVWASTVNYRFHVTSQINLDYRVIHIDENHFKFKAMKKRYGPAVKIHDPGRVGAVLLTSEADDLSVDEIMAEFELADLDDYLNRSRASNQAARQKGH